MGLIGDPRIVFSDEPTAGLDPRSRRTMWQLIRDLVAGGATIFLTTQYLEEADQLADRVALLDHGRLIAQYPRRAQAPHPRRPHPLRFASPTGSRWPPAPGGGGARRRGPHPPGPQRRQRHVAAALLERLDDQSIQVDSLSVHTPDLDDVFLTLTGQPANDDDKASHDEHALLRRG